MSLQKHTLHAEEGLCMTFVGHKMSIRIYKGAFEIKITLSRSRTSLWC